MRFKDIRSFNAYTHGTVPKHPWIDIGTYEPDFRSSSPAVTLDFYRISIKYGLEKEKDKGFMYFTSPNQSIEWDLKTPFRGYYIQITEDLISKHQHLNYSFLSYGMHLPLSLKKEEERIMIRLFKEALEEYDKPNFAMDVLLAYCNMVFAQVAQFYKRQFGERKEQYNALVNDFFNLLESYYAQHPKGGHVQPSVNYFAKKLAVTPNYLSDIIKYHTGKPALEHIHQHIVKTAKPLLKRKKTTISEVAYELGFAYPNYFSRLFRKTTGQSPSFYRNQ